MRSFIAVELENHIALKIKKIQQELQTASPKLKFVNSKNIHITLRFLGEINDEQCFLVKKALSSAVKNLSSFKITLSGIGCFPSRYSPKILWVGIKNPENLKLLTGQLNSALTELGFEDETRPFKAHVTIARIKNSTDLNKKSISAIEQFSQEMPIEKITLFKSTLTKNGAIHEKLYEVNLRIS